MKRGKSSWRIKYDVGTDENGKRLREYVTVQGTKREAEAELAKRLNELAEGRYVPRTVETVESRRIGLRTSRPRRGQRSQSSDMRR
jgi:hypothetical protein